jgi:hypothetical protein
MLEIDERARRLVVCEAEARDIFLFSLKDTLLKVLEASG